MATRIVEVRIGADAAPLLLVDGESVDLVPGEDPEQAGMNLIADDAHRAGRAVSVVLVLDGDTTRWRVRVHPDGTVTDEPDAAPSEPERRARPPVWLVGGAAAVALLVGGGYVAVTTSTQGPGAPAASDVAVPTWAAELSPSAERARPTSASAPTTPVSVPPVPVLAAAPAPAPQSPPTRAAARTVRAPAATEQTARGPSAADPVQAPPDEQPAPAPQEPAPAPLVEQEPTTAATPTPGTGSSQRARSQPSSSASATPSVSSLQRGRSGT